MFIPDRDAEKLSKYEQIIKRSIFESRLFEHPSDVQRPPLELATHLRTFDANRRRLSLIPLKKTGSGIKKNSVNGIPIEKYSDLFAQDMAVYDLSVAIATQFYDHIDLQDEFVGYIADCTGRNVSEAYSGFKKKREIQKEVKRSRDEIEKEKETIYPTNPGKHEAKEREDLAILNIIDLLERNEFIPQSLFNDSRPKDPLLKSIAIMWTELKSGGTDTGFRKEYITEYERLRRRLHPKPVSKAGFKKYLVYVKSQDTIDSEDDFRI